MILPTVVFEGRDYTSLQQWLNENIGKQVEFANHCSVWLEDDYVWRTTPYNVDDAINYDEGWEEAIRCWLEFWDEPRNERGDLLD